MHHFTFRAGIWPLTCSLAVTQPVSVCLFCLDHICPHFFCVNLQPCEFIFLPISLPALFMSALRTWLPQKRITVVTLLANTMQIIFTHILSHWSFLLYIHCSCINMKRRFLSIASWVYLKGQFTWKWKSFLHWRLTCLQILQADLLHTMKVNGDYTSQARYLR